MNTLDEVIKRLEDDIHTADADSQLIMLFDRDVVDALHYLREYQEQRDQIDALPDYYDLVNFWVESQVNLPLTWDELEQMEGKPVWIQEGDYGYWIIIDNFSITSYGYHWLNSVEGCLEKEYMGISWQAYRKEK